MAQAELVGTERILQWDGTRALTEPEITSFNAPTGNQLISF
jgi:hypothetical protein